MENKYWAKIIPINLNENIDLVFQVSRSEKWLDPALKDFLSDKEH